MPNKFDQQGWESEREDAAHENALAMRGDEPDAADVFDEEETLP